MWAWGPPSQALRSPLALGNRTMPGSWEEPVEMSTFLSRRSVTDNINGVVYSEKSPFLLSKEKKKVFCLCNNVLWIKGFPLGNCKSSAVQKHGMSTAGLGDHRENWASASFSILSVSMWRWRRCCTRTGKRVELWKVRYPRGGCCPLSPRVQISAPEDVGGRDLRGKMLERKSSYQRHFSDSVLRRCGGREMCDVQYGGVGGTRAAVPRYGGGTVRYNGSQAVSFC